MVMSDQGVLHVILRKICSSDHLDFPGNHTATLQSMREDVSVYSQVLNHAVE